MAIKFFLLPFVQTIDADGVSRIYTSINWMENPVWIKSGNWAPIYFYLMGSVLKIFNNQFYTPLIVNIIFSIITLFPLYFLFKRIYNESTALILCFLFSLSPIIFRLSLLTLAETPYLFFVSLSAYVLYKGLEEKEIVYVFLGGIIASVAGGFRYESWMLSFLVSVLILIKYSKKDFLAFLITSFIFPCIWLISNYLESGNFFSSFNWATVAVETNKIDSFESLLRRIWFYPLSLIFAFGPIGFFYFIKTIKNTYKHLAYKRIIITYGIIFFIVFFIFLFNTIRGSLLLQHRFTITLFLISFPLFGYYFIQLNKKKIYLVLLFAFSGFALSYVYSSKGARAIPRLLKNEGIEINNIVKSNVSSESGLILDFWGWENTFCIAFMSDLPRHNITFLDKNNEINEVLKEIKRIVTNYHKGFILVCNKGRLKDEIIIKKNTLIVIKENIYIPVKPVKNFPDATLYEYFFTNSKP
ncbi:MAG: hypothetical protein COX07_04730 [Bacteroidetes bacterium CG23_combo_of_CG06-09_8_20_14_all_32_9]|nr:MAG: hypothetical protein COX07_04730 [Bacteroidetes bacterium CG23_combo_of_CG06-09_8_20_14_all_32_9]